MLYEVIMESPRPRARRRTRTPAGMPRQRTALCRRVRGCGFRPAARRELPHPRDQPRRRQRRDDDLDLGRPRRGLLRDSAEPRGVRGAVKGSRRTGRYSVITSYSIHYTKLYESIEAWVRNRATVHRGVRAVVELLAGGRAFDRRPGAPRVARVSYNFV